LKNVLESCPEQSEKCGCISITPSSSSVDISPLYPKLHKKLDKLKKQALLPLICRLKHLPKRPDWISLWNSFAAPLQSFGLCKCTMPIFGTIHFTFFTYFVA
jgi:hypothetical protein